MAAADSKEEVAEIQSLSTRSGIGVRGGGCWRLLKKPSPVAFLIIREPRSDFAGLQTTIALKCFYGDGHAQAPKIFVLTELHEIVQVIDREADLKAFFKEKINRARADRNPVYKVPLE